MLLRTAEKSARYGGELVVLEPLDAVRRHLPFSGSQGKFIAHNFKPVGAGTS